MNLLAQRCNYTPCFRKLVHRTILLEAFDDDDEFSKAITGANCFIGKSRESLINQLKGASAIGLQGYTYAWQIIGVKSKVDLAIAAISNMDSILCSWLMVKYDENGFEFN